MEESLEIYQLRLEHKRFFEDAEQERTAKEKLREELVAEIHRRADAEKEWVAEIHRRADAEKMIRVLKDEKMKLTVELERLQRLEREWEVKALGSSTGMSSKKIVEADHSINVIELLDSDDDEKAPFPIKSLKMRPSSTPQKIGLTTSKGEAIDAKEFSTAMFGIPTNNDAMSSMRKKRDAHQLSDQEEVKEVKKAKVMPTSTPLSSRDKGKRKEDFENSSSGIPQPSSFTDSTGLLDASATSSVMGDLFVEEMPQSSPAKEKNRSIPTSKTQPWEASGSGKQPSKGASNSNSSTLKSTSTTKDLDSFKTPPVPIKAKDEGDLFVLNPERAAHVLSGIPFFAINPPAHDLKLPRQFLTNTFGLPMMGFIWDTRKKKDGTKKIPGRNFQFLTATYQLNPNMPSFPGGPGLLLSCRKAMLGSVWSLFAPVRGEKMARWNYLGEYKPEEAGMLTHDEFQSQTPAVREKWGKKIAEHKKYPEYLAMRARITFRKRNGGKEPDEKSVETEIKKIKENNYAKYLSAQDVINAFDRGEESISIISMKCVSYNAEFAQELADKLVPWTKAYEAKKPTRPKKGTSKGHRKGAEEELEGEGSDAERTVKKSMRKPSGMNSEAGSVGGEVAKRKMPIRNATKTRPVEASLSVEEDAGMDVESASVFSSCSDSD